MVTKIAQKIGDEIKRMNPYFNSFAVNCFQLPNGQVVAKFFDEEFQEESINDCQGIAFYIRIEPKAKLSQKRRKLTSCDSSHEARQTCYLVAYNFETKKLIDSDIWVNRLAKCLQLINDNDFTIQITNTNSSFIDNYIEETKKKFNVTKYFNCVKVTFDVIYDLDTQDCNHCDIYKSDC